MLLLFLEMGFVCYRKIVNVASDAAELHLDVFSYPVISIIEMFAHSVLCNLIPHSY